jgi:hypothetical protein
LVNSAFSLLTEIIVVYIILIAIEKYMDGKFGIDLSAIINVVGYCVGAVLVLSWLSNEVFPYVLRVFRL